MASVALVLSTTQAKLISLLCAFRVSVENPYLGKEGSSDEGQLDDKKFFRKEMEIPRRCGCNSKKRKKWII